MPELAEVFYFSKQWLDGRDQSVIGIDTHPDARVFRSTPARALTALDRKVMENMHTHGKRMLCQFSGGFWLELHLGMTGKLLTTPPETVPEKHDHLVLRQKNQSLVFRDTRMFGKVQLHHSRRGFPEFWQNLPPQPHEAAWTRDHLEAHFLRRPNSPVKAILLDQSVAPGLGNWMVDEVCWRSKLFPGTMAGRVSKRKLGEVWRACREVACAALEIIGADWSDPPDCWLFRHRWRDGGSCPRCGRGLIRAQIATRTTCYCPKCQKSLS